MPWDWYQPVDGVVAPPAAEPKTLIHKLLGEGGTASYIASGEVAGQLLNQFSMSEYEGDLRVATTTYGWNGTTSPSSAVRVLRADGTDLAQIGMVDGLGTNEQIYAVRFLGTQGYVVTFRQMDPLYVVDLSDPTAPVVSGELKIPGHRPTSTLVGDGLLLGVGQDGSITGQTLGTQLSLFDADHPANPQRLSTLPDPRLERSRVGSPCLPVLARGRHDRAARVARLEELRPGGRLPRRHHDQPGRAVIVAQLQGTTLVGRGTITHENRTNNTCWNPLQRSMVIGTELVTISAPATCSSPTGTRSLPAICAVEQPRAVRLLLVRRMT